MRDNDEDHGVETITWIVADLSTGEIREENRPAHAVSPEEFMRHTDTQNRPGA